MVVGSAGGGGGPLIDDDDVEMLCKSLSLADLQCLNASLASSADDGDGLRRMLDVRARVCV
jgi:hypothetical protein